MQYREFKGEKLSLLGFGAMTETDIREGMQKLREAWL